MGFEVLIVGGDGTLRIFPKLPDGVGAASGADRKSTPKERVQVIRRWGVIGARGLLLSPTLFGVVDMAQIARAGNRGIIGAQFCRLVFPAPAKRQKQ